MEGVLKASFRRGIQRGRLRVTFASGAVESYGGDAEKDDTLAIRLGEDSAALALYLDPAVALGELYADGRLVLEQGSLYALIALFKRNARALATPPATALHALRYLSSYARRGISLGASERNVAHHYNLDEQFYRLFLDDDLQYSCAYFESSDQSLEAAQLAKKRHIVGKLLVEPEHRVLDIGSGWGGLGLYLADVVGAHVTGVTLSEPQRAVAERRARERSLGARAEFLLRDYRLVGERFDRIVSVGMFEHVGLENFGHFFAACARMLAPRGVCVIHSIGRTRPRPAPSPFIEKYVFPGSYIPALSEVLPAVERAGFLVTDIEILPLHYADTLRAWRERFVARRSQVVALYDERFFRLWEFYLAASECGFRMDRMFVFQLQLTRPQTVVPRTRGYLLGRKAELARIEQARTAYAFAHNLAPLTHDSTQE